MAERVSYSPKSECGRSDRSASVLFFFFPTTPHSSHARFFVAQSSRLFCALTLENNKTKRNSSASIPTLLSFLASKTRNSVTFPQQQTKKMAPPPLHPELAAKLAEYRKERNFVPASWVAAKIAKLNEYMQRFGLKTCVTSISGGIDSAVILALCAAAKAESGSPIVNNVGVCQPIHSSAWALERGRENIAAAGAIEVVVDQTAIHTQLQSLVDGAVGISGKDFAAGQLRSYMRTPVGYYVAQLYSQQGNPAIVMGTGNMDEDGYLAYFCKAGDGVVDVQLISDLHKSEVFQVARALGVPSATVVAPPSADLWDGQTDEDELGFTYDFVELFTGFYLKKTAEEQEAFRSSLSEEAAIQFDAHAKAAEGVHRRNKHKLAGIQNL